MWLSSSGLGLRWVGPFSSQLLRSVGVFSTFSSFLRSVPRSQGSQLHAKGFCELLVISLRIEPPQSQPFLGISLFFSVLLSRRLYRRSEFNVEGADKESRGSGFYCSTTTPLHSQVFLSVFFPFKAVWLPLMYRLPHCCRVNNSRVLF